MSRAARVGLFIVVTLAILVATIFIIGSKQYLFASTYELKTQFDNVEGLATGADVRVGGVHSGTVRDIVLPHKPGERVAVLLDLDKATHQIIKRDSIASIETEGLLGSQYLAVSFGSAGAADVRSGDSIVGQPPLEMSELFKKTNAILDSSQEAIRNASRATANLASVSAKIDNGQGTVGALVNDRSLYNNLEQTSSSMRQTMVEAQAGVTDFQENMEAMKHNFLLRGYFKNRGYEDSSDLAENEIERLPEGTPIKRFTYSAKQLFAERDSAKLKNQKSLGAGGEFLAANKFGFAVVTVTAGMEGDTQKDLVLTEARAMVVRQYLVDTFAFDDSQLKTFGVGKKMDAAPDGDWGTVEIDIYGTGTVLPPSKQLPAASSRPIADAPAQTPAPKP